MAGLVAAPFAGTFGIWLSWLTWAPNPMIWLATAVALGAGGAVDRRPPGRRHGGTGMIGAILLAGALAAATYVLGQTRGAPRPVPVRVKSGTKNAEDR